jgi:hypothetical protein
MKLEHLLMVIVAGVIIADLVAHAAGTSALFSGVNMLWGIGIEPTNTGLIHTSTATPKKGTH